MDYNDKLYTQWMDCPINSRNRMMLPCGHEVSVEMLRAAGGICPVCEMDKDKEEMKDWPPNPDMN